MPLIHPIPYRHDSAHVPEGRYVVKLVWWGIKEYYHSVGVRFIKWKFSIIEPKEYEGGFLHTQTIFEGGRTHALNELIKAFDIAFHDNEAFDPNAFIGRKIEVYAFYKPYRKTGRLGSVPYLKNFKPYVEPIKSFDVEEDKT